MAKNTRLELIKKIEKERNSRMICLMLGDRRSAEPNLNLQKQIEDDIVLYLYDFLEKIGRVNKVSLLIYSRGGNTEVPLKIINLIRKYCSNLEMIIPYRAHSAATMIAIGGDEILMNEISELGPIDPSIWTPYNPVNPANAQQLLPIETENILSFRDSMVKDFKLWFRSGKIANMLVQHINPIIIGSSHRARSLSRKVIISFLKYHIKGNFPHFKIKKTANFLLRSDSHSDAIDINKAKSLGLNVKLLENDLKKNVWDLYKEYEKDLKLDNLFSPIVSIGSNPTSIEKFSKAIFETTDISYTFETKITITKGAQQGQIGWAVDENWILA